MPNISIKCSDNTLQISVSDYITYKELRSKIIFSKPKIEFSSHVRVTDDIYKVGMPVNQGSLTVLSNLVKTVPNLVVQYDTSVPHYLRMLLPPGLELNPPTTNAPDRPSMERENTKTPVRKPDTLTKSPANILTSVFGLFCGELPGSASATDYTHEHLSLS